MHANLDCNLRWVVAKGSVTDNLISHRAQQKNCSGNKCLCNIFPSVCKAWAMPGCATKKKSVQWLPLAKKKGIKSFSFFFLFFFCLLCPDKQYPCHARFHLNIYLSISFIFMTEHKWYTYIGCDFFFFLCLLLFLRRNLTTSSWHRAKNKPYLCSPSPPHRCETQMFLARQTKPQLYPTQYEWWYF